MKNNVTTTYSYVEVKDLSIDTYQRVLKPLKVKQYANNFDETQLTPIIVSFRNGRYNVVDGQHRVMTCKTIGKKALMAKIIEGLTLEEEAALFNALNGANGETTKLSQFDIFNANVVAKDEKALGIKEAIDNNHLKAGKAKNTKTVVAFGALNAIYSKYGKSHLDRTLRLIANTWDGDASSFHNLLLIGVSEFIKIYGDEKNYSDTTLIKQLRKIEPTKVIREIQSDMTTKVTKVKAMNTIFKYYNLGLRKRLNENLHFNLK